MMPTGFRRLKSIPTFMLSLILIMQAASLAAQPSPSEPAVDGELEVLHVQGNVWLIAGAGGNIANKVSWSLIPAHPVLDPRS